MIHSTAFPNVTQCIITTNNITTTTQPNHASGAIKKYRAQRKRGPTSPNYGLPVLAVKILEGRRRALPMVPLDSIQSAEAGPKRH